WFAGRDCALLICMLGHGWFLQCRSGACPWEENPVTLAVGASYARFSLPRDQCGVSDLGAVFAHHTEVSWCGQSVAAPPSSANIWVNSTGTCPGWGNLPHPASAG